MINFFLNKHLIISLQLNNKLLNKYLVFIKILKNHKKNNVSFELLN